MGLLLGQICQVETDDDGMTICALFMCGFKESSILKQGYPPVLIHFQMGFSLTKPSSELLGYPQFRNPPHDIEQYNPKKMIPNTFPTIISKVSQNGAYIGTHHLSYTVLSATIAEPGLPTLPSGVTSSSARFLRRSVRSPQPRLEGGYRARWDWVTCFHVVYVRMFL